MSLAGTAVDFALVPNGPTSATLSSGGVATYSLLLTSPAGVTGTAAMACSGMPAHATCTVSPTAPAMTGSVVLTVTVATGLSTVYRAEPFSASGAQHPAASPSGWMLAWIPAGLLCLWPPRRKRLGRLLPASLGLLLLALTVGVSGCGSGRLLPATGGTSAAPKTPTPAGAYTLTVSASAAGTTHSTALTLTVQ